MNPIHSLLRARNGLLSRLRNVWYRLLGVDIDGYAWLRRISIPRQWSDITLEDNVSLDDAVTLLCSGPPQSAKLVIRSGTYVNRNTMFDARHQLEIGRNCLIGPGCYFTDADHGTALATPVPAQPMKTSPVVIEDDVWIGARVVVLSGVRIGRGAVVGAGAVVTRDVPARATVAGVPARVIGMRL
jgi:hypothetical protein